MTSFSKVVFLLFFLSVSTGIATRMPPNVPWRNSEDAETFLSAFLNAISDELDQQGISDLEYLFEDFLPLISEISGKLTVPKLQALNMVFASVIADTMAAEGRGSTEQILEKCRQALIAAFKVTTGSTNTTLMNEILELIKMFSEEQNEIEPEFPQQEFPSQFGSIGEYENFGAVTSSQQSTSASAGAEAQSSSTVSTTTTTSQTSSTASSTSLSSASSTSEASSAFTEFLVSSLTQNVEFVSQFYSIASPGAASGYASISALTAAYSVGQGDLASLIASSVSQATAGIAGIYPFVQAYATSVAQILSTNGVLNSDNVIPLAGSFANSLVTTISSSSASSEISTTSGWTSAGSQTASLLTSSAATSTSASSEASSLQTSSAATSTFASSGASGTSYGLSFESPFVPAFGGLNNFDFLTPSSGNFVVPGSPELTPYSTLISGVLQSPTGLTSPAANQRIASVIPLLVQALNGNFNSPLFANSLSSLVFQISQSTDLSQTDIVIEAILEILTALLHILSSAQPGVVSTDSQAATISTIVQSVLSSLYA